MAVNANTTIRKMLSMPRDLWQVIESYRIENRIKAESEALRCLVELGLNTAAAASALASGPS